MNPDGQLFLRIKAKSLAEEARIIKRYERAQTRHNRWLVEHEQEPGTARVALHEHRVNQVRRAARETHLARGFLRGRKRWVMEMKPRTQPNWENIKRMIRSYGDGSTAQLDAFEEWAKEVRPD